MNIRITRNGQKYGPYTIEELTQYVNEGSILLDDYAYNGAEWVTVSQLFNDLNTATIANDSNSYGTGNNSAVLLKILKWGIVSVVVFFGVYHLSTFVLKNTYVE